MRERGGEGEREIGGKGGGGGRAKPDRERDKERNLPVNNAIVVDVSRFKCTVQILLCVCG